VRREILHTYPSWRVVVIVVILALRRFICVET